MHENSAILPNKPERLAEGLVSKRLFKVTINEMPSGMSLLCVLSYGGDTDLTMNDLLYFFFVIVVICYP